MAHPYPFDIERRYETEPSLSRNGGEQLMPTCFVATDRIFQDSFVEVEARVAVNVCEN